MTKLLRISPDLALPTSTVTSTVVVYGGKGMGKTNLGAVIIEEMAKAGLRWRLLDPLGVSYGLRHSKDGKGKGVECLILGGVHGDIPIEPTAGGVVADFLVDEDVNVIVDFSRRASGEMWSIGEKVRFLTDLALRAFQRQGGLVDGRRRDPFFLMLDEAARYIPQSPRAGDLEIAKCVGAWEQLVEEGRNIGIGVGLLTQRSARMNKSVSELADAIFAFRTIGPNSLDAILDWLGDHVAKARIKELVEQIRSLDVGKCLVVSPGWLKHEGVVQIRERETFDSSATPKPGERQKKVSGEAAAPDLAKYLDRMKETIDKAKAADPRELQKEISRLKGEMAKIEKSALTRIGSLAKHAAPPDPAVAQRQIDHAVATALKPYRAAVDQIGRQVARAVVSLKQGVSLLETLPAPPTNGVHPVVPRPATRPATAPAPRIVERQQRREVTGDTSAVTKPQQRLLNALAELEVLGVAAPSRHQLGMVAGYNLTGGSGAQHVADLASMGYVDTGAGVVQITDLGRSLAVTDGTPTSLEELHERVLSKLSTGQRKIAEYLISIYPDTITRADLGEAVGYNLTGGSGAQHVADLVTVGAAEIPVAGKVAASALLFPDGLN